MTTADDIAEYGMMALEEFNENGDVFDKEDNMDRIKSLNACNCKYPRLFLSRRIDQDDMKVLRCGRCKRWHSCEPKLMEYFLNGRKPA